MKEEKRKETRKRKEHDVHAILSLNRKAQERAARMAQAYEPAIKTIAP